MIHAPRVKLLFIPHHMIVVGYYGITLAVHVSVCPSVHPCPPSVFSFLDNNLSKCHWINAKLVCIDIVIFDSYQPATGQYFPFRMITLVVISGFPPNLVCTLILGRSGLGLLMSKFRQFLTELSDKSIFSFLDDNLVNINGFSPSLVCALILWTSAFGLQKGKFHPFLIELSAHNTSVFYFQDNNFSKYQWIFTKFDLYIDIAEICFPIAHCRISAIFDSYLPAT